MCVNNLPRVVTWKWNGRDLNPSPLDHESNALTIHHSPHEPIVIYKTRRMCRTETDRIGRIDIRNSERPITTGRPTKTARRPATKPSDVISLSQTTNREYIFYAPTSRSADSNRTKMQQTGHSVTWKGQRRQQYGWSKDSARQSRHSDAH